MPMPQLSTQSEIEKRKQLRETKECHSCGGQSRYIHDWKVWCRTCLDNKMYPQLAHLTQEERDEKRWETARREVKVSFVNAENLNSSGVGFKVP